MQTQRKCASCEAPLPEAVEFCPACMFDLAATFHEPIVAEESAELPRTFGEYELLERIGEGGFGVVFKARQRTLKRVVAVKMLRSGLLAGSQELKRFQVEAQAVAVLNHPNFVPVYEVGQFDGRVFFSMEYIPGPSLASLSPNAPLPAEAAAQHVKKLADAMQYAHERGVLHRDLKPANVLIDGRGEPRVTDFGLAKLADTDGSITESRQAMGTPSYMPPEQACGDWAKFCAASDVYSLGAILYYLIAGEPPFRGATAIDTMRLVIDSEPIAVRVKNRTVPRDLETICMKCLHKAPGHRYPSARELAQDLDRFLRREPIQARPATLPERMVRWSQRNPAVASALGAATLLLLLLALAAALFWRDTRESSELLALYAQSAVTAGLQKLYPLIEAASAAPDLPRLIQDPQSGTLRQALEPTVGARAYGIPSWLKLQNWLLLRADGETIARWPETSNPSNRAGRDYFKGALRAVADGSNGICISKVYQSDDDDRFKFGVSKAVRAQDGSVVGVLALMVDTLNLSDALGAATEQRSIALVGEWDQSSRSVITNVPPPWLPFQTAWQQRPTHALLLHRSFGSNNLALPLAGPIAHRLFAQPSARAARNAWSVRGYRDPVEQRDLRRFLSFWIAGVSPVPNTPFIVVYQTRDRFTDAMLTAAGALSVLAIGILGTRFAIRRRHARKESL